MGGVKGIQANVTGDATGTANTLNHGHLVQVPALILFHPLQRSDKCGQRRTQPAALTPNVGQAFPAQKYVHRVQAGYPIALGIGLVSGQFQSHVV